MEKLEIEAYLSYLATHRNVSAITQNQAFNVLIFLYKKVLDISLENENINVLKAKQRIHLPTVLSTQITFLDGKCLTGTKCFMSVLRVTTRIVTPFHEYQAVIIPLQIVLLLDHRAFLPRHGSF